MIACRTPIRRSSTSATGAMPLVVQLAHEITCSPAGGWFTPWTTVATIRGDGRAPAAVHGVVTQQVGQVVRRDKVADRAHPGTVGLLEDLQRRAADPAQAVDRDAGHGASPSMFRASFPWFMVAPEACSFLAARSPGPCGRRVSRTEAVSRRWVPLQVVARAAGPA